MTLTNKGTICNNAEIINRGAIINEGDITGSVTGNPVKDVEKIPYLDWDIGRKNWYRSIM